MDKEFSSFNYTPGLNPVAGANVPVTFSGTTYLGPISMQYGTGQSPTWDANTATNPSNPTTTATASYIIQVDNAQAPPQESYAIIKMSFNEQYTLTAGNTVTGNDGLTLFEYFCAGGASACSGGSAATGGINMAAKTAGFIEFVLSGNSNGSSTSNFACFNNGNTNSLTDCATQSNAIAGSTVNFANTNYLQGFQAVAVYSTLSVTSAGDDISLNYFKDNYYQILDTPEPATFGLLGMALAALGLLKSRKRR